MRLILNFRTCRIGGEVGLDFYERAERASNDYNFKLYIYLILPCIYFLLWPNFVSDFGPHVAVYYVKILLFM